MNNENRVEKHELSSNVNDVKREDRLCTLEKTEIYSSFYLCKYLWTK
jgi:hypothetical protein